MPRKPKLSKHTVTVIVNGTPVSVILHPPTKTRRSWYAYWPGLVASKSTGQAKLEDAILVAESMLKNGGKQPTIATAVLTDGEFEKLQRAFFDRKTDPQAQARAQKTLTLCLEATKAFKEITGLAAIAAATPDDCASFQRKALTLPKNWRMIYPKSKKDGVPRLSANTVLKWSDSLQAAFERANRNGGRKCVRGVVSDAKLLDGNPWKQFTWIEGHQRPLRQFDAEELLSLLDFLEKRWPGVSVAPAMAQLFLWSGCRKQEVAGLAWSSLRLFGDEVHFEIVGKWAVKKWFRIPLGLYQTLLALKTDSPYVFAAYTSQLHGFYKQGSRPWLASLVEQSFTPELLGDWMHNAFAEWSGALPNGRATAHVFRKTSLQHARSGEDLNRKVAEDARVSEAVMMTHYVTETAQELRNKSNRTYHRILASLPVTVATRYGHCQDKPLALEDQLHDAIRSADWKLVASLSAELAKKGTVL